MATYLVSRVHVQLTNGFRDQQDKASKCSVCHISIVGVRSSMVATFGFNGDGFFVFLVAYYSSSSTLVCRMRSVVFMTYAACAST